MKKLRGVQKLIRRLDRKPQPIDLPVEVVAWTKKAVLVRAVLEEGAAPGDVWVWANEVTRK